MSGVKQFAVDAGVIIYLDHALSARQYFADYDYRLTGLENAVDHSGWRDFAVERGVLSGGGGYLSRQYYGADAKMIAIAALLGCERPR